MGIGIRKVQARVSSRGLQHHGRHSNFSTSPTAPATELKAVYATVRITSQSLTCFSLALALTQALHGLILG